MSKAVAKRRRRLAGAILVIASGATLSLGLGILYSLIIPFIYGIVGLALGIWLMKRGKRLQGPQNSSDYQSDSRTNYHKIHSLSQGDDTNKEKNGSNNKRDAANNCQYSPNNIQHATPPRGKS